MSKRPKKHHLKFNHLSLQYTDTPAQNAQDLDKLFARGADVITGTEVGDRVFKNNIKRIAKKYGYVVNIWRSVYVAVRKDIMVGRAIRGAELAIEGNSSKTGKHTDRGLVWITFEHINLGWITAACGHYVTKGRPGGAAIYRTNLWLNERFARLIGRKARQLGKGARLFFYSGDQNIVDKLYDTFLGKANLTSGWDERRRWENTGHGNIDVIASYDPDGRVELHYIDALPDREIFFHTDHSLVEADYDVEELAA